MEDKSQFSIKYAVYGTFTDDYGFITGDDNPLNTSPELCWIERIVSKHEFLKFRKAQLDKLLEKLGDVNQKKTQAMT